MSHAKDFREAGTPLKQASSALILLHGRGATALDILSLAEHFSLPDFYIVAPQAANYSWYPQRFLAPPEANEPWLSSAIALLDDLVGEINKAGIPSEKIFIMGFSQGACLTLEFATRRARKWGGVISFTGGLIGDKIYSENYIGNFEGCKVFIGNSDRDPHVPAARSEDSRKAMEKLGATVTLAIYPGMAHTIVGEEINVVKQLFFP